MKQVISFIAATVLLVVAVGGIYLYQQQKVDTLQTEIDSLNSEIEALKSKDEDKPQSGQTSLMSEKGVEIAVDSPTSGSSISSPLEVAGRIPGNWSFEAQFTVRLLDSTGKLLEEQPAQLQGDWMTEEMVPFAVTLVFTPPENGAGTLVLVKANPSGMEQNDDSLSIPVTFN